MAPNGVSTETDDDFEKTAAIVLDGDAALPPATFSQTMRFADKWDWICTILGAIGAIATGLGQPFMMLIFGDMLDALTASDKVADAARPVAYKFLMLGAGVFVSSYLATYCFTCAGVRQTKRWRAAFLEAVLRQDIGWFDVSNPSELTSRIGEAASRVEVGLGKKTAEGIQFTSMAIGGFVLAFFYEPLYTLVLIATTPVLALCGSFLNNVTTGGAARIESAYSRAGGVASEVLAAMRTVTAFNAQPQEVRRYCGFLSEAQRAAVKLAWDTGLANGAFFGAFDIFNAVATLYGVHLLAEQLDGRECLGDDGIANTTYCPISGGRVLTVMFCVQIGGMGVGQIFPAINAMMVARRAIAAMLSIIDRKPVIDVYSDEGLKPAKVEGRIEVEAVDFSYPARPDIQVCNGYSLTVEPNTVVALVGASGSGKSTIVNLVERFYDPQRGCVKLDGVPLTSLNLRWLRHQIGYVGQEPRLFSGTIMENISHGDSENAVSEAAVVAAAKKANAHDFIMKFPQGYATLVGEGGAALSGGQKQRVAIARALVKNPRILILDEATSALDSVSERTVQVALDALMREHSMTTIVIAHRLSTIRGADNIAVVDKGHIVEEGTHDVLVSNPQGLYRKLWEKSGGEMDGDEPGGSMGGVNVAVEDEKMANRVSEDIKKRASLDAGEGLSKEALAAQKAEAKAIAEAEAKEMKRLTSRLWALQVDSKWDMAVGLLGAFLSGACYPALGIMWAEMIAVFYDTDTDEMRIKSYWYGAAWTGLGIAQCLFAWIQYGGFGAAGQSLTRKLREASFTALLAQEVAYFDEEENSSGALCARLSMDVTLVQDQTGGALGRHVMNVCCLGIGLAVSLYYSPLLALVAVGTVPLMTIGGMVQLAMVSGTGQQGGAAGKAGAMIGEAVNGIRTVATLTLEKRLVANYLAGLEDTWAEEHKTAIVGGFASGYSEFIFLGVDALLFYVGAVMVDAGTVNFKDMFLVIMVLLMSSFGLGQSMSTMGDGEKTAAAIRSIFKLLDRKPSIDSTSDDVGTKLTAISGNVEFDAVNFTYPTRPDVKVCDNYSFKVPAGSTLALCGESGSGKSTAIQLLERFYDPHTGAVKVDGVPLTSLNARWLRTQIGFVQQEPVLFAGTVRDNILYGAMQGTTDEDVQRAAELANAHDFIMELAEGYDTQVGDRGSRLSGGQKQRVAIARALVNRPKILLLDEATSALDSESEKLVQASIDGLMKGHNMTTIVVAHRLSTIRGADMICVVHKGRIVESGTHDELMAIPNGKYVALVRINKAQV